jgi:plasmid rolling circle replication initiator protein Rep
MNQNNNKNNNNRNDIREMKNSQVKTTAKRKRMSQVTLRFAKKHVSVRTYERMEICFQWFKQVTDMDMEKFKIWRSYRCTNRFCPICSFYNARKESIMVYLLMRYVEVVHRKEFLLLTLTAPNVTAAKLRDEVGRFNDSLKKMFKRKELLSVVKGSIRKLEITYNADEVVTKDMWHGNPERKIKPMKDYFKGKGLEIGSINPNYDTYHTHFHVVLAVDKRYFTAGYVKHERWLSLWQEAMGDPSITQVRVQRVKGTNTSSAAKEISKYMAKHSDMNVSQEVFDTFYTTLKGRQVITFGGLFKEARALYKSYLKKKGKDKKDDIFNQFVEEDTTDYVYQMLYQWGDGEYIEKERRELTLDEKMELHGLLCDECEED